MNKFFSSNIGKIILGIILMIISNVVPLLRWLVWLIGAGFFAVGGYPYAVSFYNAYIKPLLNK